MKTFLVLAIALLLSACGGSSSGSAGFTATSSSAASVVQSSSSSVVSSSSSSASSRQMVSSSSSATSSETGDTEAENTSDIYGLYVSLRHGQSGTLLGNADEESAFLAFLRNNGFNYVIFYDLEGLDPASIKAGQVASLIGRARSMAGVKQVAAAVGAAEEAETVVAYNQSHAADERIDVLNVEAEFWNKADRETAFNNTLSMLRHFKEVGAAENLKTEIYIGWITEAEGLAIGGLVDRVLVHFYRQTDTDIINYGVERLQYLAAANSNLAIAPIFSSEGPLNTADLPFMGTWLETHPHQQAYETWLAGFDAITQPWKAQLRAVGPVWYVYDKFPQRYFDATSHIVSDPQSQTACIGDDLQLSVTSTAIDNTICWVHDGNCAVDGERISGAGLEVLQLKDLQAAEFGDWYARVVSRESINPTSFSSAVASITRAESCAL